VVEIGIPRGAPGAARAGLISERVLELFPPRARSGTKFASGVVVVVGGSTGLTGAPTMAALAAMRTGAGYVTVGAPASLEATFSVRLLEAMMAGLPEQDASLTEASVEPALEAITETTARYARAALEAGADGIFFAIVRLAREGALTREEYARFGRPYDLRVLEAVQDASLNVLHICGEHVYFDAVTDYPVHAISWNSQAPGNPSFGEAVGMTRAAVMGGVAENTTLPKGTPEDVTRAVESALSATGGRRALIAAGCSVDPSTPVANLQALRDAARAWRA
jgi:hypothetical protein